MIPKLVLVLVLVIVLAIVIVLGTRHQQLERIASMLWRMIESLQSHPVRSPSTSPSTMTIASPSTSTSTTC